MRDLSSQPDSPPDASESEPSGRAAVSGRIGTGPIVFGLLAVALWASSWLLPDKAPIAVGRELWIGYSLIVLGDSLRALGILSAGIAVACVSWRWIRPLEGILWRSRLRRFLLVAAGLATLPALYTARFVNHGLPSISDEVAMLFQARNFARGTLAAKAPPPELARFFRYEFIIEDHPRRYGKYTLGPSAVLVPGVWAGIPWVVNPLLGGAAVLLFYVLGRELFNDKIGRIAALLGLLSPFRSAIFTMMMSHPGCLVLATLMAVALIRAARDPERYRYWAVAGLSLGLMMNFRVLTALALGGMLCLCAAVMLPWRRLRPEAVLAFVLPFAAGLGLFFAYNRAMTGDLFLTPFERYSRTDRIGFGDDVSSERWESWDRGHDLNNALKNVYLNLDAMAETLTGWGRGTLVLMAAAFLVRGACGRHLLCLMAIGSLVVAYFFYYASGSIPDQARYWSEAMAFMLLLVAGGLTALRIVLREGFHRFGWDLGDVRARAAVWAAALGLTAWSIGIAFPQMAVTFGQSVLGFGGQMPSWAEVIRRENPRNALLFLPHRDALNDFTFGATMNAPDLDGDIVYARDRRDRENRRLIDHYPGRTVYRLVTDPVEPTRLVRLSP